MEDQNRESERVQMLLVRVQEDKKKLSEKVNKLTANGMWNNRERETMHKLSKAIGILE